jgi:hypothetical protein
MSKFLLPIWEVSFETLVWVQIVIFQQNDLHEELVEHFACFVQNIQELHNHVQHGSLHNRARRKRCAKKQVKRVMNRTW